VVGAVGAIPLELLVVPVRSDGVHGRARMQSVPSNRWGVGTEFDCRREVLNLPVSRSEVVVVLFKVRKVVSRNPFREKISVMHYCFCCTVRMLHHACNPVVQFGINSAMPSFGRCRYQVEHRQGFDHCSIVSSSDDRCSFGGMAVPVLMPEYDYLIGNF
jgi:hypothetical protein